MGTRRGVSGDHLPVLTRQFQIGRLKVTFRGGGSTAPGVSDCILVPQFAFY